jgi:hypothetical protein
MIKLVAAAVADVEIVKLAQHFSKPPASTLYGVSDADISALAHFLARFSPEAGASPARARSAKKGPSAAPK